MKLAFTSHIVLLSHLTLNSSFHVPLSNNQSSNWPTFYHPNIQMTWQPRFLECGKFQCPIIIQCNQKLWISVFGFHVSSHLKIKYSTSLCWAGCVKLVISQLKFQQIVHTDISHIVCYIFVLFCPALPPVCLNCFLIDIPHCLLVP